MTSRRPAWLPEGAGTGLLLTAVLLYALNLRTPITALAPVAGDIAAELHLSAAAVGVLSGLPVLCFSIAAPAASALIARLGVERAVTVSLVTLLLGTVLRSSAGFGTAIAGTLLIGLAITAGNIALPVIVRRDFPGALSAVTGLYIAAMNLGSVATTTLTAPLADAVGWRWALAAWGGLALLALAPWQLAVRRRRRLALAPASPTTTHDDDDETPGAARAPSVLRRPITWLFAVMFAAQAFSYYAVTAWLPEILGDLVGMSPVGAGTAAATFQLWGIVGCIVVPLALSRGARVRAVSFAMAGLWVTLPLGLLLAPELWLVWASLAGIAQGGNITVVFTAVLQRATSVADARRLSAAVQGIGYAVAATGPSVLGAAHSATGTWTAPLLITFGAMVAMVVSGWAATRPAPPPAVRPVQQPG